MRARYDAAQTTADNRRHWANADGLSARSANSPEVRRTIRNRARYEVENNSYARGIASTLANDCIGTGPRLQLLTEDAALNKELTAQFEAWSAAIGLSHKLWTMRQAKVVDGESFALLLQNPRLESPVKLDIKLIESDQVAEPFPFLPNENDVDGIEFDDFGNPVAYNVLREHPGDTLVLDPSADRMPASQVIHWFRCDRPGQARGVSEFTPALELFAQLRRFTLATIAAAETAADFAGLLETDAPADGCEPPEPFEELEIVKRMLMTLPAGAKLNQLKSEHPATTYEMFKREIINEIARCLNLPYNIAACNSSGYNYSSGKLDHQTYFKAIGIEQYWCELIVLDRILTKWLREALLVRLVRIADQDIALKHAWFWDGFEHIDPNKEATAQATRLQNNTSTLAIECAKQGYDWRDIITQRSVELAFMDQLAVPATAAPTAPDGATPEDRDEDQEDDEMAARFERRGKLYMTAAAPKNPSTFRINATGAVEIQAAKGEGKRPTFSITAYTGAPMLLAGFFSPVIIDLAGFKASREHMPVLFGHDDMRVVGQTDSTIIDDSGVRQIGTFTSDEADARMIVGNAKNGFEWQASVGASIVRQEFLKAGEKAVVNGREVVGPMLIAREARLHETSFVAIGADSQTTVNVAASKRVSSTKGDTSMAFEQWLEAKGFSPDSLDDTQRASLKAMYDAEKIAASQATPNPAPPPPAARPAQHQNLDQIVAARRAEDARVAEIERIVAQAIDRRPGLLDEIEKMAKMAVDAKSTPAEFELAIYRATESTVAPTAIIRGTQDQRGAPARVIEAAVCMSGGLDKLEKHFDERTLQAAHDRFKHGLGLRDLLIMAARENGHTSHFNRHDVDGLLRAAFQSQIRAQGWSTLSLPGILSNTANKFLVAGFNAVETTWRQIGTTRTVNDFKEISSYALTGGFTYEEVGPGGELKHATVSETEYNNRARTYGRMFAITRTDLINDDLGALSAVPRKLGRGAALKLNNVFWTAFMDNSTFFTTARGNYFEGAATNLQLSSLVTGTALFLNQTDPDGDPVAIQPRILLVPNALWVTANNIVNSTQVAGDTTANTLTLANNPFAGAFTVAKSSYLSNSSYTGNSTTAWYLLADPQELSTIEVAFLNGRQEPIVESADADFNTLGIQFRGYFDFGVALQEYRAGIKSKGAA